MSSLHIFRIFKYQKIVKFKFKILKLDDELISDMFQLWGEFENYVTSN